MTATFKIRNAKIAEAYCLKNIGPRMFYLHNKIGGSGWVINKPASIDSTLTIEDDKKALIAVLTLSDYIR